MKKIKDKLYILKVWKDLIFSYPKLSLEKVDYDKYWRDKRGNNLGSLSIWQKQRADIVIETLRQTDESISIADIACGDGSILYYLSRRLKTEKLIGTDISEFALTQARELGIKTEFLNVAEVNQLHNIPTSDYLLLFEILEHVPHSEVLLRAAYDKSAKGVFFSFPNTGFFVYRLRLLFGRFPVQWRLNPGEHLRFWTVADLNWWLNSLDFKKYKIFFYQGMPSLNKIWPSMFAAALVVYLPK